MSAFADVFRKEIPASATDIICNYGKTMRGTLYDNGRTPDILSVYSLEAVSFKPPIKFPTHSNQKFSIGYMVGYLFLIYT